MKFKEVKLSIATFEVVKSRKFSTEELNLVSSAKVVFERNPGPEVKITLKTGDECSFFIAAYSECPSIGSTINLQEAFIDTLKHHDDYITRIRF